MWLLEAILYLVILLFILFQMMTYSIRWHDEARLRGEERSIWECSPRLLLSVLAEMACYALMLLLLGADLIIFLARAVLGRFGFAPGSRGQRPPAPPAGRPVVLLHGLGMRGLTVWPLALRLRWEGRTAHIFTYWPPGRTVEDFARQLHGFLEGLRRERGCEDFDVVAHSLGGLVARCCIRMYEGDHRIRRLVTLGTPHGGSELWRFSMYGPGRQLRPGGELLRALDETGLPAGVEAWAIASDFDEMIIPNANARWEAPGVTNIAVENLGHARMIFSGKVYGHIREALS